MFSWATKSRSIPELSYNMQSSEALSMQCYANISPVAGNLISLSFSVVTRLTEKRKNVSSYMRTADDS